MRKDFQNREAVRSVLESARAAYPELVRDREQAYRAWQDLCGQVNATEAVFRAFGEAPPSIAEKKTKVQITGESSGKKRGQIETYLDQILEEGPKKVKEIQAEIQRQFGVKYGESSLYRVLMLRKDKYQNAKRMWNKKGGAG